MVGLPELFDYKFYCFSGVPKFLHASKDMTDHTTAQMTFLNLDLSPTSFIRHDYLPFYELPPKPSCYQEMLDVAKGLSSRTPFVRVDLFEYKG